MKKLCQQNVPTYRCKWPVIIDKIVSLVYIVERGCTYAQGDSFLTFFIAIFCPYFLFEETLSFLKFLPTFLCSH